MPGVVVGIMKTFGIDELAVVETPPKMAPPTVLEPVPVDPPGTATMSQPNTVTDNG